MPGTYLTATANGTALTIDGVLVDPYGATTSQVLTYDNATSTFLPKSMGAVFGNQSANLVYAGPSTGAAVPPTFRALVAADLPVMLGASGGADGTAGAVPKPLAGQNLLFLRGDATWQTAASGTVTQITMGTGLSSTQSPLTTSGTMSIDQSFTPTWTGLHTYAQAVSTGFTPGVSLQTTSTAVVNAQKSSLGLELVGSGWGTTGGAAQAVRALLQLVPVQSTTAQADVVLYTLAGGGAYTETLRIGHNEALGGVSTSNVLLMKSNSNAANYINSGTEFLIRVGASDSYATWSGVDITNTAVTLYGSNSAIVKLTSNAFAPSSNLGPTLGDSTHAWTTTYSRHFASAGTAPTVTGGTGAGSGGSLSLSATGGDSAHLLSLTTGNAPAMGVATVCTVNFNTAFDVAPHAVVILPANANANGLSFGELYVDAANVGTGSYVITNSLALALAANTLYKFWAIVIQ